MSCNFSDEELYEVIGEIKDKADESGDGLTRLEAAALMILDERLLVEELLVDKIESLVNLNKDCYGSDSYKEPNEPKSLNVTSNSDAIDKVSDVEFFGSQDLFRLISKASSKSQGWMKSTKVCNLDNGVLVQITTQNKENVAEALEFVPNINWDFLLKAFVSARLKFV